MKENRRILIFVQVVGILNLLFGLFGALISPMFFLTENRVMMFYSGYITNGITNLSMLTFPLMVVLLLVTGVGLVLKREWGRRGAVITAYFVLAVHSFAAIAVMMLVSTVLERNVFNSDILAGVLGTILSLAYPGASLIFLTRPAVKAALARKPKSSA